MLWHEWRAIASDEAHWKNTNEKGLLKAEYLEGYVLRLWFEEDLDVSIYDLDWNPLLLMLRVSRSFLIDGMILFEIRGIESK